MCLSVLHVFYICIHIICILHVLYIYIMWAFIHILQAMEEPNILIQVIISSMFFISL